MKQWSLADTPRLTEHQAMTKVGDAIHAFALFLNYLHHSHLVPGYHEMALGRADEAVRLAEQAERQREAVAAISEALDLFGGMLFRLHDRRPYLGIITARHMHAEMMARLDTLSARERAGEGK